MEPWLICFDMDRVLIDHLSTWQYVYDRLGISNDESFDLYNQGKLDEWDWLKLDLALIDSAHPEIRDDELRTLCDGTPEMAGLMDCLSSLIDAGHQVAIISGGMQESARRIAQRFPNGAWKKRWGGMPRHYGSTKFHVFTNGWLRDTCGGVQRFGRYQVQMNGKGTITKMLQRRLGIPKERTVSIGDSAGDIGMFKESALAICFNPWDDKPKPHADMVIEERNLSLVLKAIEDKVSFTE